LKKALKSKVIPIKVFNKTKKKGIRAGISLKNAVCGRWGDQGGNSNVGKISRQLHIVLQEMNFHFFVCF
jgi:hypothetical protein